MPRRRKLWADTRKGQAVLRKRAELERNVWTLERKQRELAEAIEDLEDEQAAERAARDFAYQRWKPRKYRAD